MRTHRKLWNIISLTLASALALAACAPAAPVVQTQVVKETEVVTVRETQIVEQQVVITATPEPFKPKGTLAVGLTTNVAAIEVPYAPERQSANASWTMFDSLIFPEPDGTFSPMLAESWEISDDGREITFKLRQDVTFHDGSPFNADSVVFSYEAYTRPEVTYPWATAADGVEKIDDYTVKVVRNEPNSLMLTFISGWSMIPVDWGGKTQQEFAERPIGTGPFMLDEWVKGDHLTVVANPNYWNKGYPKVERVVFRFLPESATRIAAVQTGEIDIAPRLTSEEAQSLLGVPGVQIIRYPVNRVYYLAFNNLTTGVGTPIEDANVRKAMAHAVDVQAIIDALFDGYATRAVGFVGPGDLGFDNAEPVPYDPDLAKQMLAEAGYPSGFAMDMACPDGAYSHINEVCQAIREQLNDVGITGDLSIMESNAYWDLESKKELPPLFVDSWSSTTTESYGRLEGALAKDETYANWYNEELGGLILDILTAFEVEERAQVYRDIQTHMREDPPFVYLYYPQAFEAITTRVQNYQPRAAENYFLWDVSVSDE
jgi:peptide/nickel transport system substrate-binding protein